MGVGINHISSGLIMSRDMKWIRDRLDSRLRGANWYIRTESCTSDFVVFVTSVETAKKYCPTHFYNIPIRLKAIDKSRKSV